MQEFLKGREERKQAEAEAEAAQPQAEPAEEEEFSGFKGEVVSVLKSIYDPEIPVDLYSLGLIYELKVDEDTRSVYIVMTLTTPMCPVAESLPEEVRQRLRELNNVGAVIVDLTWDPPWDTSRLNDAAKLEMGLL